MGLLVVAGERGLSVVVAGCRVWVVRSFVAFFTPFLRVFGMNDAIDTWPQWVRALPRADDHPVPLAYVVQQRGQPKPREGWLAACVVSARCWICGRPLDRESGFVVNVASFVCCLATDPPAHVDCAAFPLTRLRWSGGPVALWRGGKFTARRKRYDQFGFMELGKPFAVDWFLDGQPADMATVRAAVALEAESLRQAFSASSPQARNDIDARIVSVQRVLARSRTT